jgi:alanine racemase
MDTVVVDVTGREDVKAGDVATLLGEDDGASIGLAELARLCGTIDYEILTGLGDRLPRLEVERLGADEGNEDLVLEALETIRDGI